MAETNLLLTPADIAYETAAQLKNHLKYTMMINRQYASKFGVEGAMIGDTFDVRMPTRYVVHDGPVVTPQFIRETSKQLTLTYEKTLAVTWTTKERTLSMEAFSERYITPMVTQFANEIDLIVLRDTVQQVHNVKGTPGTRPADSQLFFDARAQMADYAVPRDRPWQALLPPKSHASMVKALQGLFHDGSTLVGQYRRGYMQGASLGFDFDESENMPSHTVGALGGTPVVSGASQTGASLNTSGWTATTGAIAKGDVFTIAGVRTINPLSRETNGDLQQFVAKAAATADGSGLMTISIDPPITPPAADGSVVQYQTVTASPANSAAITVVGAAGTVSQQGLCFHPDYATVGFATPAMPPEGAGKAYTIQDEQLGLGFRVWEGADWNTGRFGIRFDFIFGTLVIYPSWAVRIPS